MIYHYAELDNKNCVSRFGSGYTLPQGAIEFPPELTLRIHNLMLVDGVWVERPNLSAHVWNGTDFEQVVPVGSHAFISDHETKVTFGRVEDDEGRIAFALEDEGSYLIEIYPQGPFVKKEIVVHVHHNPTQPSPD